MSGPVSRETQSRRVKIFTVYVAATGERLLTAGFENQFHALSEAVWQRNAGRWLDVPPAGVLVRAATDDEAAPVIAKARYFAGVVVNGHAMTYDAALLTSIVFWRELEPKAGAA